MKDLKLAYFFAKRYFFSKKSVHAINIISGISVVGVLVSTASLIAILSFYNGLENLILSMFSSVASEIRIEPARGKIIDPTDEKLANWANDSSVLYFHPVLEEKVLVQFGDKQYIARLKGVEDAFENIWATDSLLYHGDFKLYENHVPLAIIGQGINQAIRYGNSPEGIPISLYSPKKGTVNTINPASEFIKRDILVSGIMGGHEEVNDLVIVPLEFARELLSEFDGVSAIEINSRNAADLPRLYAQLKQSLGDEYAVLNREEQNPTLYKIIRSEKWAIFAILTFTGFIAVLNIIGSLTMLVIDKRKDIAVLRGIGANDRLISLVFFLEGMMITLIGSFSGLIIGGLLCLSQMHFGWLKFGQSESLLVEAYPVDMRLTDFVLVFSTVFFVSLIVSYLASRMSIRQSERLA